MVGGERVCFSHRFFLFFPVRFSSLSSGWFCLAVLVGGVARLRGCRCAWRARGQYW